MDAVAGPGPAATGTRGEHKSAHNTLDTTNGAVI